MSSFKKTEPDVPLHEWSFLCTQTLMWRLYRTSDWSQGRVFSQWGEVTAWVALRHPAPSDRHKHRGQLVWTQRSLLAVQTSSCGPSLFNIIFDNRWISGDDSPGQLPQLSVCQRVSVFLQQVLQQLEASLKQKQQRRHISLTNLWTQESLVSLPAGWTHLLHRQRHVNPLSKTPENKPET